MNHTNILLDRFKKSCSLATDMAAAEKIGVGRGTVSGWRHQRTHAEPESVELMAKAVGLDAEEWVLRVQADREIVPARKQVWLRAARRLASTAAIVALSFGLDVHTAKSAPIQHSHVDSTITEPVYIMRS
jgi:plasmid maintenance system antidote protein VapI